MGFLSIFKSIEDLLYEVMTWLVFYPRTFVQVLIHPLKVTEYSDLEQSEASDEQYTDLLSPPIFLLLTILIGHGVEISFGNPSSAGTGTLAKLVLGSEETLIFFRLIMFSLFPLMFALAIVKRSDLPLDRKTLKAPFFAQCYIGGFFAAAVSIGSIIAQIGTLNSLMAAVAVLLGALLWYGIIETAIIARELAISKTRAAGAAVLTLLKALLFTVVVSGVILA